MFAHTENTFQNHSVSMKNFNSFNAQSGVAQLFDEVGTLTPVGYQKVHHLYDEENIELNLEYDSDYIQTQEQFETDHISQNHIEYD